jgi:hypothetical protein
MGNITDIIDNFIKSGLQETDSIKRIKEFPNYFIFNIGEVFSIKRKIFLRKCLNRPSKKDAYFQIGLKEGKIIRVLRVHQLVAQYFVENPSRLKFVNHIDGNKLNNHFKNLEWVSASQNTKASFIQGRKIHDNTKRKNSEIRRNTTGRQHHKSKPVINIHTQKIFHSASEASIEAEMTLGGLIYHLDRLEKNNKNLSKTPIINIKTNEIFYSLNDACRESGLSPQGMIFHLKKENDKIPDSFYYRYFQGELVHNSNLPYRWHKISVEPFYQPNYLDKYRVFESGAIYNCYSDRWLVPTKTDRGLDVTIGINGKPFYHRLVHRIVAEVFIPNAAQKSLVYHKDGNKSNNNVDNLFWCNHAELKQHYLKLNPKDVNKLKLRELEKRNQIIELTEGELQAVLVSSRNYVITSKGRVYSYLLNRFLSTKKNSFGYSVISHGGKGSELPSRFVHRLVALAFINCDNPENMVVHHRDFNPANNAIENLKWCTTEENLKYSANAGRMIYQKLIT